MTRPLYAVKDIKIGFSDPVCLHSDAEAVRQFGFFLKDVNTHPENYFVPARDFQMWRIGFFDLDTGYITCDQPVLLADGASFIIEEADIDA